MDRVVTSELLVGLCGTTLNYAATFYLPKTKLLQDPLETLISAIPILWGGHVSLMAFMLLAIKKLPLKQTLVSLGYATSIVGLATAVFHGFIVLFGAPLLEKFNHTLAFASYLAILTVYPSFAILAPAEPAVWMKVFLQHNPSTTREIYAYSEAICTLSGAWIGAIVLPLDWERDWQVWPISCVISTFLGHAVGVITAFGWSSFKRVLGKKKNE